MFSASSCSYFVGGMHLLVFFVFLCVDLLEKVNSKMVKTFSGRKTLNFRKKVFREKNCQLPEGTSGRSSSGILIF